MVQSNSSGHTLPEVMMAVTVLSIGFLGVAVNLLDNTRVSELVGEEATTTHVFREFSETIRTAPFENIVAVYQDTTFGVDELTNASVSVHIFVNETDSSARAQEFGLPRDLDGDGAATTTDVSSNYVLLPVEIQLTWDRRGVTTSKVLGLFLSRDEI